MPRNNTRLTTGVVADDTDAVRDADVIMTAAIVGFSAKLLSEGKPVRFDTQGIHAAMTERDKEDARAAIDNMTTVVARINRVLSSAPVGGTVEQGTSPAYDYTEKVIFGVKDGDRTAFLDRNVETAFTEQAQELHDAVSRKHPPGEDARLGEGYRGIGAYTGLVVPPEGSIGRPWVTSTFRIVVPDENADGERWRPTQQVGRVPVGAGPKEKTWGMIGDNDTQNQLASEGMGFVPEGHQPDPAQDIVGYTHGMTQAVVECERRADGSRPFEIAVGEKTTKLASCFGCTLFMYACDYPPSSIHIDRAESWVPMYTWMAPEDPTYKRRVTETTEKWRRFCTEVLWTGSKILERSRSLVSDEHLASLNALREFLEGHTDESACANLILDALTVHDKESARVLRTIKDT